MSTNGTNQSMAGLEEPVLCTPLFSSSTDQLGYFEPSGGIVRYNLLRNFF